MTLPASTSSTIPAEIVHALSEAAGLDLNTPVAAAARLLAGHATNMRFVPSMGWFVFEQGRWVHDVGDHRVTSLALQATNAYLAGSEDTKGASRQLGLGFLRESLVFAARYVLAEPDDFDGNPYLLGLPGSQVLDLTTRQRRPMLASDMVTRVAGAHPDLDDPTAALYLRQLVQAMWPDESLREYVRAATAYTLTGSVHEERMFVLFDAEDGHPQGRRGKSTFLDTLRQAMGDYAMQAPDSLLVYRKTEAIPTDIAGLKGRRLAWANELPDSAPLDEARVKQIVSTGAVAARFMRQDYFTFQPTHHVWVTTNTLPSVRDTGEGIWRRLTLIPVSAGLHTAAVCDLDGEPAILSQLPHDPAFQAALLRWALPALHTSISDVPGVTRSLTETHRANQDAYGLFFAESFVISDTPGRPADGAVTRKQLWQMFLDWSAEDRERTALRNQRRLYSAIRSKLPAPAEIIDGGKSYYPQLRVRS